jgi:alkaline phosphatase D
MTKITRRNALISGLAVSAASCSKESATTPQNSSGQSAGGIFAHGVASGDPGRDSAVIWTRISLDDAAPGSSATVIWEVASDRAFDAIVAKGETLTGASRDWTVKTLLTDLEPGTVYYYRFRSGEQTSPVGRTRTLPAGAIDSARFAVVSCTNFPFGYFNVYDQIAQRGDIDAVIHLGDYIYEYGRDGYGGEAGAALGREHEPAHEIITIDDYRRRHAQYKADPSSQAMHAAHTMIAIWDDHETSNNSWKDGAENHQPDTEGEWVVRRRAALQAYYEWMPVREPAGAPEAFFRSYSYGDLLTLCAIETRLMARARGFEYGEIVSNLQTDDDVAHFKTETLWDQSREMLGRAQTDYLARTIRQSVDEGQPWRLIANQIIMAKVITPDLNPYMTEEDIDALQETWDQGRAFVEISKLGLPTNFDAWDGYPAARERFYEMVHDAGGDGMIVVTGDTHTWWANDLTDRNGEPRGVELGAHSVTSPSPYRKGFLGGKGSEYTALTVSENNDVRYLSGENHGYIDLEIGRDTAKARFMAIDTVESRDYKAFEKIAFTINRTDGAAKFSDS